MAVVVTIIAEMPHTLGKQVVLHVADPSKSLQGAFAVVVATIAKAPVVFFLMDQ